MPYYQVRQCESQAQEPGAIVSDARQAAERLWMVDQSQERGRFVLTGSQHFGLMEKISQSPAGRVGRR